LATIDVTEQPLAAIAAKAAIVYAVSRLFKKYQFVLYFVFTCSFKCYYYKGLNCEIFIIRILFV